MCRYRKNIIIFKSGKVILIENFNKFALLNARVAELVDALDSKSSDFGRVGSIPTSSTIKNLNLFIIK